MDKLITFWETLLKRVLHYPRVAIVLSAFGLAFLEVIRRRVFGVSFHWQQDIVVYFILAAVYLQLADTQWDKVHLKVTVFMGLLLNKGRIRDFVGRLLSFLAYLCCAIYTVLFVYWGVPLVIYYQNTGQRIFSQVLPFWPFFLLFVIGFGLLAISFILQCFQEFQFLLGRKERITRVSHPSLYEPP